MFEYKKYFLFIAILLIIYLLKPSYEYFINSNKNIYVNDYGKYYIPPHHDRPVTQALKKGKIYEHNTINSNDKLLGIYCAKEITHNMCAGFIGPEFKYIWDQLGYKQIVRTLYQLEDRIDVWEWERDITDEETEWQVKNINEIIKFL